MDSRHILAIDLGTSGPKVALVAEDGQTAAQAYHPVRTTRIPPEGAEQDPEEIWQAILEATRTVLREARCPAGSIVGILCSSHYFSLVPVDANADPTGPLLVWMDRRGAEYGDALVRNDVDALVRWLEVHGALPFGNDSLSHMLYVKNDLPEVYARTHCFLEPVDFVGARLTGRMAANPCTAFALLLTDNRDTTCLEYDSELVRRSGIDPAKLPPLIASDAVLGSILPGVAAELGLAEGTPVFSGINDTQAVTMGTGTHLEGRGGLNVGTTIQVLARAEEKRTDAEYQIVSMPSPVPGQYLSMAEVGLGGKLVEHFLQNLVYPDDPLGHLRVDDRWERIDAAVATAPPGSNGLLFLPFLTGAQAPRQNMAVRGGFLNITLETTRAAMLRSVLEGIALHLRWMLPGAEAFCGRKFDELYFSGGGATSDQWAQIMADVMDRPVLQLADARQANTRGAAFLAFSRLGIVTDAEIDLFCPIRRRYEPRAGTREAYDRLFTAFVATFEATESVYAALNAE